MKGMEYKTPTTAMSGEILDKGTYKGYEYVIASYGSILVRIL